MMNIKQRLTDNYLIGCIKYRGAYDIYLMPIAWWILNYKKYDPSCVSDDRLFRDNILNVGDDQVEAFLRVIEEDKISIAEFGAVSNIAKSLSFFIDFDGKLFINGTFDNIEVEEYLPDENWVGRVDYPINYLPDNLKRFFEEGMVG